MKRVHVLEFEDLRWFPSWLRTSMTNLIVVISRLLGVPSALGALVSRVLRDEGIDQIVDLGSGGGGSMPEVLDAVRAEPGTEHVTLVMTDLYPNLDAVRIFDEDRDSHIRYLREPVDATHLESAPRGLKTMVNCFHHMRPEGARAILSSAQENREPILIYEMGDNNIPFALWVLLLPLSLPLVMVMALGLTPMARPLTVRQLVFTYLIPVVPIFYAWDGQASMPRIYTPEDLDELLAEIGESPDYRWEKGFGKTESGRTLGTYLLGVPVKAEA